MSLQVVYRPFDFLKVPNSAFQFCLARPIAALLIAEIEVVHQQVGQRGFFRLFQSVQKKLLLFIQVCDPALQPTDGAADGLHQAVGGSNVPVQIAEKGFHPALYHLVCSGAKMHGRYLLDALPLKGAQVNTFWSASRFQIAVGDGLPAMPPNFGIFLIVQVHRVFLVTLPVPGREPDALTVFVKVVYLSGFRELLAVFVHCPERQQNVGVWVSIFLVVDGKVSDHSFVIFITENDVIKAGLPIYHVDRTVRETGTVFNDQAHIVYVNSQIKDETALETIERICLGLGITLKDFFDSSYL